MLLPQDTSERSSELSREQLFINFESAFSQLKKLYLMMQSYVQNFSEEFVQGLLADEAVV